MRSYGTQFLYVPTTLREITRLMYRYLRNLKKILYLIRNYFLGKHGRYLPESRMEKINKITRVAVS